jgi:hypothetical protein
LTAYAITNIGVGVPPQSTYYQAMQRWRDAMRRQLLRMSWNPLEASKQSIAARLKRHQDRLKRAERAMSQILQKQQGQLAGLALNAKLNVDAAREYAKVLQGLAKDGPDVIKEKLKEQQPLTRWAAAMVAGRSWLHLETELIDRLADPSPQVREAAREALVRLSRGNDFGPLPKATAQQIAQAVQAWRQWLALQDPPERIPEYLPRPQLAEAEEPPERVREALPSPQLAEAEDAQP